MQGRSVVEVAVRLALLFFLPIPVSVQILTPDITPRPFRPRSDQETSAWQVLIKAISVYDGWTINTFPAPDPT